MSSFEGVGVRCELELPIVGIGGISGAVEVNGAYLSPNRFSGEMPLVEDPVSLRLPKTVPSLLRPLRFAGRASGA